MLVDADGNFNIRYVNKLSKVAVTCFTLLQKTKVEMTSQVDEKFQAYRQLQADIQGLFTLKQQTLSQYNENTLVKGVRN